MYIKKTFRTTILMFSLLLLSFTLTAQDNDEKYQDLLDNAEHLTLNNRVDDAIAVYDKVIEVAPKKPLPYYKKGELLITKGRFVDAIQILEQGVKLENPNRKASVDEDKVSEDYLSALELLGNLYSQLYKAKEAVFYYEAAYNLDTNEENKLRYQLEILNILFAVKRHQFAEKHINLAKKLSADNFDVRFFEAQYHNALGSYDKALPILEVLIKEVPLEEGNEKYYFELGVAYFRLGKYKSATETFDKITAKEWEYRKKPFTAEYNFLVALAFFEIFQFDDAENYLNIALQLDPASSKGHELNQKIAGIKQPKGKLIDAKKSAAESAEKEGKTELLIESLKDLSALYYQNGDYEFALDAIQRWEALDKQISYFRILLKSMCEYKMGQPEDAFIMLNKSVKNPRMPGPDKARFNVARGVIYMSQKKYKEAEAAFKAAFKGPYKSISWEKLDQIEIIKAQSVDKGGKGDEDEGSGK